MMQQQQQQQHVHPMSFMMNGEKSEISCVRCRSHHRRCDKSIPTCMECLTRGYECVYQKPKKRGRKQKNQKPGTTAAPTTTNRRGSRAGHVAKDDTSNGEVITTSDSNASNSGSSVNSDENTVESSTYRPYIALNGDKATSKATSNAWAGQLIDLYFQFTGRCPSLIEREIVEGHLEDNIDATSNVSVERKGARALLNAIQAVTLQRLGQKQDAQVMFEKTRELCLQADVYESHVSNFHVAAAMITMAMWLVGERREAAAKMYLNNVYFYIEQLQEKSDLTEKQKEELSRLNITVGVVELMLSLNFFEYEEVEQKATGTGGVCDRSISNQMQSKLRKRLEICKRVLSRNCFSGEEELNVLFDKIFENQCGVGGDTNVCVLSLKQSLDQFERIDECLQIKFKETPALLLSWGILFQGFKLELLADYEYRMVCNSDPAFLEKLEAITNLKRFVADKISRKILCHSTWFPLTCNLHVKYVVMTALIHVKHAGSVGKNYTEDEILAFLKADQWALETTQKRFNFPKSEELISNIKSCVSILNARREAIVNKKLENHSIPFTHGDPNVVHISPHLDTHISDNGDSTYKANGDTFDDILDGNYANSSIPDVFPIQFAHDDPMGSFETGNTVESPQEVDLGSEMERILNEASFDFLNNINNLNPPEQDPSQGHSPIDFMHFNGELTNSNLLSDFFQ